MAEGGYDPNIPIGKGDNDISLDDMNVFLGEDLRMK
jgi:hypothetical protein